MRHNFTKEQILGDCRSAKTEKYFNEFLSFHSKNPAVYQSFEKYAKQAIQAGWNHYGARDIMGRVRWSRQVTEKDVHGFKINNNTIHFYARLFAIVNPEHKNFFLFRRLKGQPITE